MSQAPKPLVKTPARITQGGVARWKTGRGFSLEELRAVGINADQARLLGIPVDERRRSSWSQNVENLRKWLLGVLEGKIAPPEPSYPKLVEIKQKRGRAYRGLTSTGRTSRGLTSVKLRESHNYKSKKKARERALKKRHDATKGLYRFDNSADVVCQ